MTDLSIARPLTLKCGLTLPNRLVKAAMAEGMADRLALPNPQAHAPYDEWANGGWGMIITGNVEVDMRYLGGPSDNAFNDSVSYEKMLEAWKAWAMACSRYDTPTIVQINHPGRQSPLGAGKRGFFEKSLAPSAVPIYFGDGLIPRILSSVVFGTPREMTAEDIQHVVGRFADTARLSADAGFAGVEIHAAHGYLLAQFLSESTNKRTDEYGGSPTARAKIVVDIIKAMRAVVPKGFCIGIKLNSADHQFTTEFDACLEQLKLITAAGVDFLEISGGSFENPTMATGLVNEEDFRSERTRAREAFFIEFANSVRKHLPEVPLMVTGGFRSRKGMEAAMVEGSCDLVGLGRPAILNPTLPKNTILNSEVKDEDANLYVKKVSPSKLLTMTGLKMVGAAADSSWHQQQLKKMGQS
ncbi:NADH:flavin oxidoreductase/NADH oxidase [Xylariales sp. AK1849]|nr:NADH:flavin oxidoreductase/NADH oxidase [Xylariales sp. AK1849]